MQKEEQDPVALVLLILFVTLIVSVSYLFWETSSKDQTQMRSYFDVIYRISTLVSLLAALYVIQFNYRKQVREEKHRLIAGLQQDMVDIQQLFLNPDPSLQQLYAEMNGKRMEPREITLQQTIVGNVIFRKMETVLNYLGDKVYDTGYKEYIRTWSTWFTSPLLQRIWSQNAFQYSTKMQTFVSSTVMFPKSSLLQWQAIYSF